MLKDSITNHKNQTIIPSCTKEINFKVIQKFIMKNWTIDPKLFKIDKIKIKPRYKL